MPKINVGGYLFYAFIEIGPTRPFGMGGETTIDWHQIVAYSQATGEISEKWELRLMMEMSKKFLSEKQRGTNPMAMSPVEMRSGH